MCDKIIFKDMQLRYCFNVHFYIPYSMCPAWLMLQTPVFPNHLQYKTFLRIFEYVYLYVSANMHIYTINKAVIYQLSNIYLQTDEKSTYQEYRLVSCHWNSDLLDVLIHQRVPLTESTLNHQSYSHCVGRKSIFVCIGHYWYINYIKLV